MQPPYNTNSNNANNQQYLHMSQTQTQSLSNASAAGPFYQDQSSPEQNNLMEEDFVLKPIISPSGSLPKTAALLPETTTSKVLPSISHLIESTMPYRRPASLSEPPPVMPSLLQEIIPKFPSAAPNSIAYDMTAHRPQNNQQKTSESPFPMAQYRVNRSHTVSQPPLPHGSSSLSMSNGSLNSETSSHHSNSSTEDFDDPSAAANVLFSINTGGASSASNHAGQKRRQRRKFDEVERFYKCNWKTCSKSYGTLNHLNHHVMLQKHGQKRLPEEFTELRRYLRTRKSNSVSASSSIDNLPQVMSAESQNASQQYSTGQPNCIADAGALNYATSVKQIYPQLSIESGGYNNSINNAGSLPTPISRTSLNHRSEAVDQALSRP